MSAATKVLEAAMSLPVDERARVVDSLLRSLNVSDPDTDRQWASVAAQRLEELRSGRARPVPFDEVITRLRGRFAR